MTPSFTPEYHCLLMKFIPTHSVISSRLWVWGRFADLTRGRVDAGQGDV